MTCLGSVSYDPTTAVSQSTTANLAMTALDTTNLRLTFTAPSNGNVMVRLKGQTHGSSTFPGILLGVLDGSTVRGRMAPTGARAFSAATTQNAQEVCFLVTGLTPTTSYTWDAAYGVENAIAATGLKYGGPDNTTTDDAFGSFQFEVWTTENLIAGKLYDPAVSVTLSTTALLAMTAMDTTNLRHTFTAPSSGKIFWRVATAFQGSSTAPQVLLGIMESSTVRARCSGIVANPQGNVASQVPPFEASGVITGLTPGNSYTFDAAYGVEIVSAAGGLKYGGPNDTTADNARGGTAFEIWVA
jgi:hypothetical protein